MRLLKQSKPQCLLYAFAMAWDMEPEELIQRIGHDGLEIWWPEASGAFRHRGFHYQEFVDVGLSLDWLVLMIEAMPILGWKHERNLAMPNIDLQLRIDTYLRVFSGVLVSDKHAVAWNAQEQKCYDPNGVVYGVDNFAIREFFITIRGKDAKDATGKFRGAILGCRSTTTDATR